MNNIASYLFASAYSSFSPTLNTAAAVCSVNGQQVACPQFLNILGPAIPLTILVLAIIMITAVWKIFTKAGQPGWASIVPIYNMVVMLSVVKKPTWWVILGFIPVINIIIGLIVVYELAKVFGKGFGFTLGLILLPIIFYPILGFGKATYIPTN
ncbi:MAG: DUF5684 domain-containing protein [bacterium]